MFNELLFGTGLSYLFPSPGKLLPALLKAGNRFFGRRCLFPLQRFEFSLSVCNALCDPLGFSFDESAVLFQTG